MAAAAGAAAGRAAAGRGAAASGGSRAGKAGRTGRGRGGQAEEIGAATGSDQAELRRQAAAGDALLSQAYEAGQAGEAFDPDVFGDDPAARDAWETGRAEQRSQRRADTARRVSRPVGGGAINDGAGIVLGMVVYALVLNFMQGGSAQAKGWIAAKFINQPYRRGGRSGGSGIGVGGAVAPRRQGRRVER